MSFETASSLQTLLKSKRILVVLGAGGVGKTSISLGLACASTRLHPQTGLLSIDPARRLASAIGLTLSAKPQRLPPLWGETSDQGLLFASMIDQKAILEEMVRRHSQDEATAQKILFHPLYGAISSQLAGAVEYMALAQLRDMTADRAYNMVVLDTPPDTHALDFLSKPNILRGFMERGVLTWLVKPFVLAGKMGLGKIMTLSERLMGGLSQVAGFSALKEVSEFLVLIQHVIEGFHAAGEETAALLKSPDCGFLLITTPTTAGLRTVQTFLPELKERGLTLEAIIVNRCAQEVPLDLPASLHEVALVLRKRFQTQKQVLKRLDLFLKTQGLTHLPVLTLQDQNESLLTPEGLQKLAGGFLTTRLGGRAPFVS